MAKEGKEIVINAKYRHLEEFIQSIPEEWEAIGETIYKNRNEIKKVTIGALEINIKSFEVPHYFGTAFRPSKAKRSYRNAQQLQNLSVATPDPIAYIECTEGGKLKKSFYLSIHLTDYALKMRDAMEATMPNKELVLRRFTRFTYFSLIRNGVNHLDYARGNTLIKDTGSIHQFSIVGIDNIRFGKMNEKQKLKMLVQSTASEDELSIIADEYAGLVNQDPQQVKNVLLELRKINK